MKNIQKNMNMLPHAKDLRRNMTDQERKLWYCFLKEYPVRFYRQKIVESFIVDFYCASAKLVIELDGSQHYNPDDLEYDRKRTDILKRYGLKVLRFTNQEINEDFRNVCECIIQEVNNRRGQQPHT